VTRDRGADSRDTWIISQASGKLLSVMQNPVLDSLSRREADDVCIHRSRKCCHPEHCLF